MNRTEAKEIARTLRRYAGHEAMMEAYANGANLLFHGEPVTDTPNFDQGRAVHYTIAPVKKKMQVKGWVRTSGDEYTYPLGYLRHTEPLPEVSKFWTEFTTEVEYNA